MGAEATGDLAQAASPAPPDPFDRLLVAQAQVEGATLVTADRRLAAYEVNRLDAAAGGG